ncbi:MAG: hypothetical protein HYU66_06775, partial [Armatimonadetes bacterium]|nr:hypothetical protein [Armatimonadota bacterium]
MTILLGSLPAAAQYGEIFDTQTRSFPGFLTVGTQNQYLRLDMRLNGIVRTTLPASGNTPAQFLGYSNYRGGRVYFSTINGDPFTTADDSQNITARDPFSTRSVIRVGPAQLPAPGQADPADVFEVESLYRAIDDPTQEIMIAQPASGTNGLSFTWQVREDTPPVAALLINNPIVDNPGLAGSTSAAALTIKQTYQLIRDMVRVEIEVVNVSAQDQTVGIETYFDGSFGGSRDDGTSFYVNTVRQGLTKEFLFPSQRATDDPGLRQMPNTWRTFDNERSPGVILGGIWDGADVRSASLTAGPPDQTMFVNAALAGNTRFGYIPVSLNLQGDDWAELVRWNGRPLSPGQVRRYITYFGLGGADSDFAQPYALSVEAPFSLALATGDDPNTAAQESSDNVYRNPNPFTVSAYITNVSTRPLTNMAVSLALPSGFTLSDPGDTITRTISTVPAGQEQQVSWQVRSLTTQAPGTKTIAVSASGSGLNSKVVNREIGVPALPSLQFPSLNKRLDMISVPYDFLNRDIEHVFASLGAIGVTGGGNAAVARYNPAARAYAFFPDAFITTVLPGEGIWLFNGALADLVLPTDRFEVTADIPTAVALNPDWNQLGCPYTIPTRLFDSEVVTSDNVTRTFADAVNSGIIRPVLYEYVPNAVDPNQTGSYTFTGDSNTLFSPWRGYWIRVLQQVTFVYHAGNQIGPFRALGFDPLSLRRGWEFSLQAAGERAKSETLRLGQDATSLDGYDTRDVDLPPAVKLGDLVRLAVVHNDWGRNSGAYLRDIRGASPAEQRWQVQADAQAPNQDVTLRWNLRTVPADVQLTLVDLQTGERRHMRTTSGYTFNAGPYGRSRLFEVVASRNRDLARIVSMQAVPVRGRVVSIGFTLSTAATVEVVVESVTGRVVRTVARGLEATAGQNVVDWDGRDSEHR